jgi:twinkle protein
MSANDLVACIATFETKPKPHYQRIIRQLRGRGLLENLETCKIQEADAWIRDHYRFIIHREERPTLEWLLNQAEIVISRDGAKILQIDPWNRMEATKEAKENDTDYIGRCLRVLYAFANDYKVHVQVLAHPSKMDGHRRGMMPTLEDIANSKHWENMCDQGFVVHRPKLFDDQGNRVTYAELHHLKARFDALGFPAKFGLDFDPDQGRYGTCPLLQRKKKSAKQEAQQPQPEDYE